MEKVKDLDLYLLLGVNLDADDKEIRKAYRKKALQCHPDKNPDNPEAANKLFHQLSDALAVLIDPAARKAYDNLLKARKAADLRNRQLDAKRKKLKEELEAREADQERRTEKGPAKEGKSEEERFRKELERLQREGQKELEEEQRRVQELLRRQRDSGGEGPPAGQQPTSIRLKWRLEEPPRYDEATLRSIFSKYGDVLAVVVHHSRRTPKNPGTAKGTVTGSSTGLVELNSGAAAHRAAKIERGFQDNPLKVKVVGAEILRPQASGGERPSGNFCPEGSEDSLSFSFTPATAGPSLAEYESLVMRQMRQAEERKRLEKEILEQDLKDEEALENGQSKTSKRTKIHP